MPPARQRLRDDLKAAMRERNQQLVSVLRTLGAALDNAEAVDIGGLQGDAASNARGTGTSDVPRRMLDERAIAAVLERERDERLENAETLARAGKADVAERLRAEAEIVARYL